MHNPPFAVASHPERLENETLTRIEWRALDGKFNLADGHARQLIGGHETAVVDALTEIYTQSYSASQSALEADFLETQFAFNCVRVKAHDIAPIYHYSSSLAIDTTAKYLASIGRQVFLIHPTFDNIPAILRRNGVNHKPLDEAMITDDLALRRVLGKSSVLFLVCPNNPTGWFPSEREFYRLCALCDETGAILVIDNSFRSFRPLGTYCDLELLTKIATSFISIEDTGKTYSTNDLKLGYLISSVDNTEGLKLIADDIMFNVSPFIMNVLSLAARSLLTLGGRQTLTDLAKINRGTLVSAI
jgi:aspartate/methionine/tyrosine aminotransferase